MSADRRTLVLLAIFLAAAGYYGWSRLVSPGGDGPAGGRVGPAALRGAAPEIEELQTARLGRKPGAYRQGRDLFRYQAVRPPQPRPAPPPPPPEPRPVESAEVTPPKPRPPAVDIEYLGSFGRPGRRIAVFSDRDAIYNALVGDVIKEKFVLVAIGYETVDIEFVGFPEVAPQRLAAGGLR